LISFEELIGMLHYEIIEIQNAGSQVRIWARYSGPRKCPHCGGESLRNKGKVQRWVRHVSWSARQVWLNLSGHKWRCRSCDKQFCERFPGLLKGQRATEAFQAKVFQDHWDGINRSRVAAREHIGSATVERYCQHFLQRLAAERSGAPCPQVLGIDEHFFSRKHGYATTFCDLKNHSVYDVVLGRSEASLENYLARWEGKHLVQVVCMDLAASYRALVRKYFPQARIVADRFHVIRTVTHHFLACWKDLDPVGSKNRGLLSLMRRHRHHLTLPQHDRLAAYLREKPALEAIYCFKQRLCYSLLEKSCNQRRCQKLAHRFLRDIAALRHCGFAPLVALGHTLHSWRDEIATMWRFTRNNAITEGFHNKMEVLSRQAYGFRNFQNYRLRVRVLCS
jgi:transposase